MSTAVIDDTLAETMAGVLKVANRFAWAAGVNLEESGVHISPRTSDEGVRIWRVSYGSATPSNSRGGGFIVELVADDLSVYRVLHGQ
jgi:hypothetical protein